MPARPMLAVLMDPLETIKPAKDSTIAMFVAASRRGCDTWCFGQGDLSARDGRAFARLTPIEVAGDGQGLVPDGRTRRARSSRALTPC